jgi:hypothetical protein
MDSHRGILTHAWRGQTAEDGGKMASLYHGALVGRYRHGFGSYTYPSGGFAYEGEWHLGVKHGLGTLTLPDGR